MVRHRTLGVAVAILLSSCGNPFGPPPYQRQMTVTVGEDTWYWDDPRLPKDQQFTRDGDRFEVHAECFDPPCPIEFVYYRVRGIGSNDSARFVDGVVVHRGVSYGYYRGRSTGFFNVTLLDTAKRVIEAEFQVTLFANNGQGALVTGSVAGTYRGR